MSTKHRILVVEDDLTIRDLLRDRLQQYDLAFATCQQEAYEILQSPNFDLVLLDLRLPRYLGDMKADHRVGMDIIERIRKNNLRKSGSAMMMPIVVMTAHGSERISAEVLSEKGANYYIKKPFEDDLEEKLARAILGEWALVPTADLVGAFVRLAFRHQDLVIRIETLSYTGAHYELLHVLADLYYKDLQALRAPEKYGGIRGEDLASTLGISGKAVRARVSKFRRDVKRDFREQLRRGIRDNDIIENLRDWQGYRLNPLVVRLLNWDDLDQGAGEG
jgi:CheY-like chemotaxis protein